MGGAGTDPAAGRRGRLAVLYHFMHPDDVVSALHFDGFAQDLAAMGWEVEAISCNRGCRNESLVYGRSETYRGVQYRRVWRPGFSQRRFFGRLANSAWMICAWSGLALRPRVLRPDVVVVGTDPVFAAAVALPLRWLAPEMKLAHWCFDLHPEAAIVSGLVEAKSLAARVVTAVMSRAYRCYDVIADLGVCMRALLRRHGHGAHELELTPWALVEPDQPVARDADTRRELFGEAKIGLLYSGNLGEAHDFEPFLALARALRGRPEFHFCFAVRGSRADELKRAVLPEDSNISFAGFASVEALERRLGSADIHLASLKQDWAGVAVPSKFFGSIASGRPVLYAGPLDSAIGQWIRTLGLGWVLDPDDIEGVAQHLCALAGDAAGLAAMQRHCHAVYAERFSRRAVMASWDEVLSGLVGGDSVPARDSPSRPGP